MKAKSVLASSGLARPIALGMIACVLGGSAPTTSQRGFVTPEAASEALIQAAAAWDVAELQNILGPGSEDLVASEDTIADRKRARDFAEKARQKTSISLDEKNPKRAILSVGVENWPLPIPIEPRKGKWYFNTMAGREEVLLRRIGANELDAITVCRGFVDAQIQYAMDKHDNSGVNQYAQKLISTPGKQDGLYWENSDGTPGGPISKTVARAIEEGYSPRRPSSFHGYYFKVLKGQGPAAPIGQLDFVINGAMIGGFALVAAPAEYKVTGVKAFIVSHDGIVFEKDLGPNTLKIFKEMSRFDPDKSWRPNHDEW